MKNPETEAISGFCCKLHFHSAEKEGFEPPEPWLQFNGFQDRRIRPLCHFSISQIIRRKDKIFLIFENYFKKKLHFTQKKCCFNLKVALFEEKRQNKFVYEIKKNNFVFN